MTRYPPRLLNIAETAHGATLFLEGGVEVSIDIPPSRLDEVVIEQGNPPLAELIAAQSLGVYVGTFDMTAERWSRVSECLRTSKEASAVLQPFPKLWGHFHESYSSIVKMPHKAYGGICSWAFYTNCPINFHEDTNRPFPWCRALLSAPGSWLFNTWVNLESGKVEIDGCQRPGHFVE